MPAFHPKTFTNPDRLKSISAARLISFFGRWPEYFLGRGIAMPETDEHEFPYDEVAKVLMSPDESVPEAMVDALYYVHETATNDAMDELLERAKSAGLAVETDGDPSTSDLALQIWLQSPDLLQRQHAETVAFNRSRFMYFAGKRLCCTNPVRDSCCESSVIAGGHEQTEHTDLQDAELASI